jgi:hypothetical protein
MGRVDVSVGGGPNNWKCRWGREGRGLGDNLFTHGERGCEVVVRKRELEREGWWWRLFVWIPYLMRGEKERERRGGQQR